MSHASKHKNEPDYLMMQRRKLQKQLELLRLGQVSKMKQLDAYERQLKNKRSIHVSR